MRERLRRHGAGERDFVSRRADFSMLASDVKLASLKSGRDGRLLVVNRELSRAAHASAIAPTLQSALDRWEKTEPQLRLLAAELESGRIATIPFDEGDCAAPLPRAYQWIDGSAYVNHVELLRRSRGERLPETFWTEPLIYQGGSDDLTAPRDPIRVHADDVGVDFEAEIAIITDDVSAGTTAAAASRHITLYMLVNDVSLRRIIPPELAKGFGFFVGKPATAFSPVAITPDELGEDLVGDAIRLPLLVDVNGEPFGRARPDVDRVFSFAELIAYAAQTRNLSAGTIVGGGTVSNKLDGGPGLAVSEGGSGYSCIAEQRAVEQIRDGAARTKFLRYGDRVRIEMRDRDGASVFGRIEQTVARWEHRNETT
jgi:fumarylacetoacetate (FAA) hydrolase